MSHFEYTDPTGNRLEITPAAPGGVSFETFDGTSDYYAGAVKVPCDQIEEVIAGIRDVTRQAGGQAEPARCGNANCAGSCPGCYQPPATARPAEARVTVYGIDINEWDRIHDALRRIETAVSPFSVAERQFLTFALDLAADRMASRGDEFTDEDQAALDRFRRMSVDEP